MAPIPRYGQLLGEFLDSLEGYTSELVKGEDNERRNSFNTVSVINSRLQSIKRDQESLQAASALLQVQQAAFERLKACAQNATLPISRLPDEALSNLLEVVLPNRDDPWSYDPAHSKRAPWKLRTYKRTLRSLVGTCSRLRSSFLNSPRCWMFVECILARGGTTLESLAMMLARTRNCRFHLQLRLPEQTFQPSRYGLQAYSQVLLPHMHQCETLHVVSKNRGAEIPRLIPTSSLSALHRVTFDWLYDRTEDSGGLGLDSKATATLFSLVGVTDMPLQSLSVKGSGYVSQKLRGQFDSIPTQLLTRLEIKLDCSLQGLIRLLRRCPNLEHLDVVTNDIHEGEVDGLGESDSSPVALSLEKLVSLQLTSSGDSVHSVLLNAPRLVQANVPYAQQPIITLPDNPPFPSLIRLAVEIDGEELAPFLQSHPGITECFIYESMEDNDEWNISQCSHLCAALESFLAHNPDTAKTGLQHLSLKFNDLDYFSEVEAQLTASLELVLHMLPRLHLDLHVVIPPGVEKTLAISNSKHSSRVSINPPTERRHMWRSAWPKEYV